MCYWFHVTGVYNIGVFMCVCMYVCLYMCRESLENVYMQTMSVQKSSEAVRNTVCSQTGIIGNCELWCVC